MTSKFYSKAQQQNMFDFEQNQRSIDLVNKISEKIDSLGPNKRLLLKEILQKDKKSKKYFFVEIFGDEENENVGDLLNFRSEIKEDCTNPIIYDDNNVANESRELLFCRMNRKLSTSKNVNKDLGIVLGTLRNRQRILEENKTGQETFVYYQNKGFSSFSHKKEKATTIHEDTFFIPETNRIGLIQKEEGEKTNIPQLISKIDKPLKKIDADDLYTYIQTATDNKLNQNTSFSVLESESGQKTTLFLYGKDCGVFCFNKKGELIETVSPSGEAKLVKKSLNHPAGSKFLLVSGEYFKEIETYNSLIQGLDFDKNSLFALSRTLFAFSKTKKRGEPIIVAYDTSKMK